jgi:hypothetical protein
LDGAALVLPATANVPVRKPPAEASIGHDLRWSLPDVAGVTWALEAPRQNRPDFVPLTGDGFEAAFARLKSDALGFGDDVLPVRIRRAAAFDQITAFVVEFRERNVGRGAV